MTRIPPALTMSPCNHSGVTSKIIRLVAMAITCILLPVSFSRAASIATSEDVNTGSDVTQAVLDYRHHGNHDNAASSPASVTTNVGRFHITWHQYIGPGSGPAPSTAPSGVTTGAPSSGDDITTDPDLGPIDVVHSIQVAAPAAVLGPPSLDHQTTTTTTTTATTTQTDAAPPTSPVDLPGQVRHFPWSAVPSVAGWNPYPDVNQPTFPNSLYQLDPDTTVRQWDKDNDVVTSEFDGLNNVLVTLGLGDEITEGYGVSSPPPEENEPPGSDQETYPPDDGSSYHRPDHDPATRSLTTMLYVVESSEQQSTPKSVLSSVQHDLSGKLQFQLKDIILAVCGTVACVFTICMLVTFTRCCCKKQKDESDEEQQPRSQHRSIWRRSWKRPVDSAASTTQTQESSTSENVTQVTIERHGDLESGDDEDTGGFTTGKVHKDSTRSGHSSRKGRESADSKNALSVRDRIKAFEVSKPDLQEVKVREGAKPRKNKPTSKAFEEFESKGILIGFGGGPRRRRGEDGEDEDEAEDPDGGGGSRDSPTLGMVLPSPTSGLSQEDTPTSSRGLDEDEGVHTMESEEDELSAVQRNTDILKSFRRAPPPKNRSKARRSGRGRRPLRQDLSSSEQIAEEPSSGSFGSRPTSGINSPETSATPDEEEHDSFEASLHMPTTESLSAARSSSISQTPQSSLDSMDSPKRQASLSSRDSPLRTSLTDSPKRQGLLDSPKWPPRESPKRTPPRMTDVESPTTGVASVRPGVGVGVSPVCGTGGDLQWQQTQTQNGHTEFSLTIPKEFQQQRLGGHLTPETGFSGVKPHRPKSYHIDVATSRADPHIPVEKFRPIRPFSHVQIEADPGTSSQRDSTGSQDRRLHDQPKSQERSHDSNRSRDPNRLHSKRPHESISRSHGHLARNTTSPIGRGVPYLPRSGSPAALRRWDSEYSYLKDDVDGESKSRDYRTDSVGSTPEYRPVGRSKTDRHKLRPKEDSRVKEHPHSEKLERKVLPGQTTAAPPYYNPDQRLQGENAALTSDTTQDITDDEAPPRPPPPCWRQAGVTLLQPDAWPRPRHNTPTSSADAHHHHSPPTTPPHQHHYTRRLTHDQHHYGGRDPSPGGTPHRYTKDPLFPALHSYDADLSWRRPGQADHNRHLVADKEINKMSPPSVRDDTESVLVSSSYSDFPQASQFLRPASYRHSKETSPFKDSDTVDGIKDSVIRNKRYYSTAVKMEASNPELIAQQNKPFPLLTPPLVVKTVEPNSPDGHISETHAVWEKSKELQPPTEKRYLPESVTENRTGLTASWRDFKSKQFPGQEPDQSLPGGREDGINRNKTRTANYNQTVRQPEGRLLNISQSAQPLHFHGPDWAPRTKHHTHWRPSSPIETTQGQELWETSTAQSVQGHRSRSHTSWKDSAPRSPLEYKKHPWTVSGPEQGRTGGCQRSAGDLHVKDVDTPGPRRSAVDLHGPDGSTPGPRRSVVDLHGPDGSTPGPQRSAVDLHGPDGGTSAGPQILARLTHGPLLFKPEQRPSTELSGEQSFPGHSALYKLTRDSRQTDTECETRDPQDHPYHQSGEEPSKLVHLPDRRLQASLQDKEVQNLPFSNQSKQGHQTKVHFDDPNDYSQHPAIKGGEPGNSPLSHMQWDNYNKQPQYPNRQRFLTHTSIVHPSDLLEDELAVRWHGLRRSQPPVPRDSVPSEQGIESNVTTTHPKPLQHPHLKPVRQYPLEESSRADRSDDADNHQTSDDSVDRGLPWKDLPGGHHQEHVFRFNFDTKPTEV